MSEKKDLNNLPKYLKPEIAERVAEHFRDGVFEFDLSTEESIAIEGNAVSWREIWRKQNESR